MLNNKKVNACMDAFLDFIYPRNIYCILCGEAIEKTERFSMCAPCREKVPFIRSRACEKCGKPLESLYLPTRCPDCITTGHYFTKGFSCVGYDEDMKRLVYKLKYGKQRYLAYPMAQIMADKLQRQGLQDIDVVVPVPLHKRKQREREFNQAQLLAKYVGRIMDWKVDDKHLIRIKDTPSQNALSKEERKNNVKNAFEVVSPNGFQGKKILIIDDIYTTGHTVDACSKELQKFIPKAIYVITFATGRNV